MRAKHRTLLRRRTSGIMASSYGTGGAGDDFWYEPLRAPSGAPMSPEQAMSISAVYACTNVLCQTIGSLPLIVYRKQVRGGKERATDHPYYELFHDQPNSYQTSLDWRQMMQGHCTLRGNAYSRIVAGARGRVDRLMPLRADRMRAELRDDGRVLYRYQPTNGGPEQVYLQDEILRLTGLSGDGINGLSVIGLARQTFAMAKNAETHSSKLFANSARPGGVLQMTGRLSPQGREHLRQSWQDLHSGPENAGRIALLEEGMTWQSVGMTSEDAQLIESRKFEIAEIARWFRIPPHMIGDLERSTNNNIEHQSIDFVVHTIRPWLVMWEQSIRRDVMSERERDDLVVEFLVDGLLRGDANARTIVYKSMLNDGWGTPNEVREKENMNPIEGGDELRSPLNMVPAGSRAPGQTADPDDQPPAAAAPEGSAEPPTPLRLAEVIHLPGPDQMPPLESDGSSIDLPVIAGEAA